MFVTVKMACKWGHNNDGISVLDYIYVHRPRYGMNGLGFESPNRQGSTHPSITAVEPIQPSVKRVSIFFIEVLAAGTCRLPTSFNTEIKESVLL